MPGKKFDWDEAKRLRKTGLSYVKIGEILGVHSRSVRYAVDERFREQDRQSARKYHMKALCAECGKPCSGDKDEQGRLCLECDGKRRRSTVGDGVLYCSMCDSWKKDRQFYRDKRRKHRRRRSQSCKKCMNAYRSELRHSKLRGTVER